MNFDVKSLKNKWNEKSEIASGKLVIDIFGDAALESWEGAEALIDAYLDLEQITGEVSYRENVDKLMYLKIKEYWSEDLTVEQLEKLDRFLLLIRRLASLY